MRSPTSQALKSKPKRNANTFAFYIYYSTFHGFLFPFSTGGTPRSIHSGIGASSK